MDKNEEKQREEEREQVVSPWEVSSSGKIDYDKLIDKFGCQRLDQSLVDRVQRLTGRPPHVFLRRGVFFAHRFFFFLSFFTILYSLLLYVSLVFWLIGMKLGQRFERHTGCVWERGEILSVHGKRAIIRSFAFGAFGSFHVYQVNILFFFKFQLSYYTELIESFKTTIVIFFFSENR